MNRTIYTLVFICTACVASAQQISPAAKIMELFRIKMEDHVASEMSFSFSGASARGVSITPFEGVIYRQGADYAMLNPEVEVYVSRNTKWIYTAGNNEAIVMYNDPSSIDLGENPLALFSSQLSKEYQISDKPKYYMEKGQEITEITIIPTVKNISYTSILLRINSKTHIPHSIKYHAKDGSWFEAVVTSFATKEQLFPPERFIFSVKDYQGVFVTDLR